MEYETMKGTLESEERRLGAALQSLDNGKSVDGQAINLTQIALNAHRCSHAYVRATSQGKASTAQKLRHRRFTG